MKAMSSSRVGNSGGYMGMSKFTCYCGENADLWRSGTKENPGRLFVKCGLEKVSLHTILHAVAAVYFFHPSPCTNENGMVTFFLCLARNASYGSGKTRSVARRH
jgi:hypothetical protein